MSDATTTRDVTQLLVLNWNPQSSCERDPPSGNQRLKPTVYQPSGTKAIRWRGSRQDEECGRV